MRKIDRTATDTIKGYFYQFDYFILKILQSNNEDDLIVIEGIEDVDIKTANETTAVQCKYYSKTEYNHSVIKRPITLMLKHFKNNMDQDFNYYIYGYYDKGQDKLPNEIELDFFKKNFLLYSKKNKETDKMEYNNMQIELGLTDEEIMKFIGRLIININAPKFEQQNEFVIDEIKKQLSCKKNDAEFYYNNALNLVKKKSIEDTIENRTITKKEFLNKINNKNELFNEWYIAIRGKKEFLKSIKHECFGSSFNLSPYARIILVDCKSQSDIVELKHLLIHVSNKLSKITKRDTKPFCPYVYLNGIDENKLLEVKKLLRADDQTFIDGHNFKGADFSLESMLIKPDFNNGIKLKIINEVNNISDILNGISKTRIIYQFYIEEPFYDNRLHKHYKIPITEINDITKVI